MPETKKEEKKVVRKFRLMHSKHADATHNYVKGDVVTVEYPDTDEKDETKKKEYHDKHDMSKTHLGQPGNPRFVEFKDGDPLPKLPPDTPNAGKVPI